MKKRKFEVQPEQMVGFAELLAKHELENEIAGKTEEGDIIINVYYETEDSEEVLELLEYLDESDSDDDEE